MHAHRETPSYVGDTNLGGRIAWSSDRIVLAFTPIGENEMRSFLVEAAGGEADNIPWILFSSPLLFA